MRHHIFDKPNLVNDYMKYTEPYTQKEYATSHDAGFILSPFRRCSQESFADASIRFGAELLNFQPTFLPSLARYTSLLLMKPTKDTDPIFKKENSIIHYP
jgi:hypothetical protein